MTAPAIYVLARPSFTEEFAQFLASENREWRQTTATPAEQLIEFAGRICYLSFGAHQSDRNNRRYIENLIQQGHESVLEHAVWTFLLTGVSRAFTHQLVRHRAGMSFSQLSQQYHDEVNPKCIVPANLEAYPEAMNAWTEAIETARRAYRTISASLVAEAKLSKEALRAARSAARSVLPNATETKIVVTANARAIRHFLTLRGSIEGDNEMRKVSALIYEMVAADAPTLVEDFQARVLRDGTSLIIKTQV